MIKKVGNFPYDISKFEEKAERLFPNEDIIVGTMDEADEEIIQNFLEDVLRYEMDNRNSNEERK